MPTTEGDRGGELAPAHRRNLGPAHGNNLALSKVIAAARQRNASEAGTADGRPTLSAPDGGSWSRSAPTRSDNFFPALGNNQMDPNPSWPNNEPSFQPCLLGGGRGGWCERRWSPAGWRIYPTFSQSEGGWGSNGLLAPGGAKRCGAEASAYKVRASCGIRPLWRWAGAAQTPEEAA
jgi:hypothetical protein